MEDERDTTTHRQRLKFKKSPISLFYCFHGRCFEEFDLSDDKRSRAHELPEIKGKCRNLISWMGRHRKNLADFSYDPLSYALNFDDGAAKDDRDDESPVWNFTQRLPSSPLAEKARSVALQMPMPKAETVRIVLQPSLRVETAMSVDPVMARGVVSQTPRSVAALTPRGRTRSVKQPTPAVPQEFLVEIF